MANLRKTKDRKEVVRKSLLENPEMETQVKSPYIIFLHAFILILLFTLLVIGYINIFSPFRRKVIGDHLYAGSFQEGVYYQTEACDLIIIKPYNGIKDIKDGDIVAYATNIEKGSGLLVSIDGEYIELKKTDGSAVRITMNAVLGKQVKTSSAWGFFPAFFSSYYSVGILTVVIIVYITIITFTRINYENTEEGKELYKQFRINQREERKRKQLISNLKEVDGLKNKIHDCLIKTMPENKASIALLDLKSNVSSFEKYKYILHSVHDALIVKSELTRNEKQYITALCELMCEYQHIDDDIEYMLVDLALISSLVDFEREEFKESAIKFLNGKVKDKDLLNFGSVLCILIDKNKRLMKPIIQEIAEVYYQKCQNMQEANSRIGFGLASKMNKIIK